MSSFMRPALALFLASTSALAAEPLSAEGFPVGEAGPATRVASGPPTVGPLTLGAEVFAMYTHRSSGEPTRTEDDRFELGRLHVGMRYESGRIMARAVVEGVRSSTDGALIGVAGDSFVLRAREAYAEVRLPLEVALRAGMVPTLTIPEIEGTWMLRAVSAVPLEQWRFASPADLGAQVRWTFPRRFGALAASVTNGEGYASREMDTRKSGEVALTVRPLASLEFPELAFFASASRGTIGVSSARNDRALAALLWQGKLLRAGLSYALAWGLAGDGTLQPTLLEAFTAAEPLHDVLLGLRVSRANLDTANPTPAAVDGLLASAGYRVAPELEVHVAGEFSRSNDAVRVAQPGADRTELRAVVRASF
jgi:hypothetical protein